MAVAAGERTVCTAVWTVASVAWLQHLLLLVLIHTDPSQASPDLLKMQFAFRSGPRADVGGATSGGSECWARAACRGARLKPVCGTDGVTYASRCEMKRIRRCEARMVDVQSEGHCPPTRGRKPTKCLEERRQALFSRGEGGRSRAGSYVPDCGETGSFAPVQCHGTAGYCWCVTPDGRPIAGTSIQGTDIQCQGVKRKSCTMLDRAEFNTNLVAIFAAEYARNPNAQVPSDKSTHDTQVVTWKFNQLDEDGDGLLRRADIRTLKKLLKKVVNPRKCAKTFDNYCDLDQDRRISRLEWSGCLGADISQLGTSTEEEGKTCSLNDRSVFNGRLIESFMDEFSGRTTEAPPTVSREQWEPPLHSQTDRLLDTPERRAITWKFADLDRDDDGRLRRNEIRPLKNQIKEKLKPRKCAKTVDTHCDLNGDLFITLNEWSVCLGVDINNGPNLAGSVRPEIGNQGGSSHGNSGGNKDHAKQSLLDIIQRFKTTEEEQGSTPQSSSQEQPGAGQGQSQEHSILEVGCREARDHFLTLHQQDQSAHIFVPVCVVGGLYRQEQCHNATGFCWCVNQQTGKPIPTTSTRNVMPNCTNVKIRQFKGCSYPQRRLFLTKLLDQLTTEMIEAANNASYPSSMLESNPDMSLEESAVRWKLRTLDKNNNNELDKNEWKQFKHIIRLKKDLRKCSRNFLRYCDENDDKNITAEEWVQCTGLHEQHRNLPEHSDPKGVNPFTVFLKGGE